MGINRTEYFYRLRPFLQRHGDVSSHFIALVPSSLKWGKMPCLFVMGIRTCYPQICHSGILIILKRRQLRNSKCKKSPLPYLFYLEAGHQFCPSCPLLYESEESSPCHQRGRAGTKMSPHEQALLRGNLPLSLDFFIYFLVTFT